MTQTGTITPRKALRLLKSTTRLRAKRNEARSLFEAATKLNVSSCLNWPYSLDKDDYPGLQWEDRYRRGHAVMCEIAHGPRPSKKHVAAHSCGNPRCINRNHLRWATYAENNGPDKNKHGTALNGERNHQAKLSLRDVRAIRKSNDTCQACADKYGVVKSTVHAIRTRKLWGSVE